MTSLCLALLVLEGPDWDVWSALLVGAGARFSVVDSCIALEGSEASEQRVRRVLSLAGTRDEELERELRKFYNDAFLLDDDVVYPNTPEEGEDE